MRNSSRNISLKLFFFLSNGFILQNKNFNELNLVSVQDCICFVFFF